ncbi:MAG: hypothetical protein WBM14_04805, partial [Terracidiphilus sp.]
NYTIRVDRRTSGSVTAITPLREIVGECPRKPPAGLYLPEYRTGMQRQRAGASCRCAGSG